MARSAYNSGSSSSSKKSRQHFSRYYALAVVALLNCCCSAVHVSAMQPTPSGSSSSSSRAPILVVGSVNVDIIMEVHRLPGKGETTIGRSPTAGIAVGGKGANQAVAAARLSQGTGRATRFVCRFGSDAYAALLQAELEAAGVDVTGCGRVAGMPSGQGMVMLEPDGAASSVVLGGSNTAWKEGEPMSHLVRGVAAVLLQREVPDHVNLAVAQAAAAAGVPVIQDVGGEERPIADGQLHLFDFLVPNESELQRLTGMPTETQQQVVAAASSLTKRGAKHVLVTLAERGAVLVAANSSVIWQQALPVPGGAVVDGTAAGDAFRAGFAVGLVEGLAMQDCLQFAAAAGALAVSKLGAVPSLPTRAEAQQLIASVTGHNEDLVVSEQGKGPGGNGADKPASSTTARTADSTTAVHSSSSSLQQQGTSCTAGLSDRQCGTSSTSSTGSSTCPYKFASRLNSMKARRDLATAEDGANDVLGWIARQGSVRGLDLVDFNYPQHLEGINTEQILEALDAASLQAGAVCIRFPDEFRLGAFTNPDERLRREAIGVAASGCRYAADLGASELIVWSPYDGYDYNFQVDYQAAWQRTVSAFQVLADTCPPGVRVSLEFKPTDESSRFSIVPSTGAALLLARDVDRPNFGLTLDVGHLLMAGENPAQSVAMAAAAGKLFGMQLNDAHVKLGAEDGLAFGAVNAAMSLELVRWLQRANYSGHIYFDTFPVNEDPVREAEYNIRRFNALWVKAARLAEAGIDSFADTHDAMAVLEALEADELGWQHHGSGEQPAAEQQQQQLLQ